MTRVVLVLGLAALFVLVLAVPAFARATVEPKECFGFTDPDPQFGYTSEFCNHSVSTPSGNRNNHSKGVTVNADGRIERTSDIFHGKPPRDVGSAPSRGTGPGPKHCSTFTDPESGLTEELCDHIVITPSGNINSNSKYEAAFSDGEILRSKSNYHLKPTR